MHYDELMNESNPNWILKVYFNYTDETKTKIDMSRCYLVWFGQKERIIPDYDDNNKSFYGAEREDSKQTSITN